MSSDPNAKPDPQSYLLDELDEAAVRAFEEQLRAHPGDAEEFAETEDAWASLAMLSPGQEPPPGAFNGVLERLPEDGHGSSWMPMIYALGGLAAGLAFMWLTSSQDVPGGDGASAVEVTVAGDVAPDANAEGAAPTDAPGDAVGDGSTMKARLAEQEQAILSLAEDNGALRDLIVRYQADREALERELRVQAARWSQFYSKDTGIARWSVLSLSNGQVSAPTTLSNRLNYVAATDTEGARTGSTNGFTSASADGLSPNAAGGDSAPTDFSEASALVLWDVTNQEGVLSISGLPDAPEGSTYQMWVQPADSDIAPESAGLLPDFSGGAGQAVFNLEDSGADIANAFITLEPAGGSATPTGTVVVSGPVAGVTTE